ncbi:MAG TPA: glutamate-binding protein, partial [Micropruina sp.]|nr:glutamate-binding protein [Micropruina sp.]
MSLKLKIGAALAAATLALSMSACAGGSSTNLQALKLGIKFDQPGLGLKEGDKYTGLDVDVATYIAGKLGTTPEKIT